MLPEHPTIDQVRAYFADDKFATQAAGCRIAEAARGRAVCTMELAPVHYNAAGGVMGGALFTLADFALAVACNVDEPPTVSVSNTIEFLSSAKGTRLTATATCDKSGRSLGFYTVDVTDDTGRHIARMTATCKR